MKHNAGETVIQQGKKEAMNKGDSQLMNKILVHRKIFHMEL